MSFTTTLLAPLVLMLPVAGAIETTRDTPGPSPQAEMSRPLLPSDVPLRDVSRDRSAGAVYPGWFWHYAAKGFQPEGAHQVRIEQRMTIRISPRADMQPNMLFDLPQREIAPRMEERPMGKCLNASNIVGVQTLDSSRLVLFMRNRRFVSATLERACRARDFYSGFYLANSSDGKLCVDRDTLQSRTGANCKLARISRLVEVSD